jgi:hypothetical protein
VYLPVAITEKLDLPRGGLLLYGGSDFNHTSFDAMPDNETVAILNKSHWDTSVWLYNISANAWSTLTTYGSRDRPSGLMYHSAATEGLQVSMLALIPWLHMACVAINI